MTTIRIKRSAVTGNPGTLANGELAYSGLTNNGANGGDRLYIGFGTETTGNAANHYIIGGKYYTDLMAGTAGTLVTNATSVPILSATGTIDKWLVGNLQLTGNTISSTATNGNIVLSPNGTGLISINNLYTLPAVVGTAGYVLTTNGAGATSWAPGAASLLFQGNNTLNTGTINLLTQTLSIVGGTNVVTTSSGQTLTVSVATATNTVLGVASFASANFTVSNGAVSITNGTISNAQLANSSVTINGVNVALGASVNVATTQTLTIGTGLTGSTFNGSTATTISIDGTVATTSTAQTFTNKTISGASNTFSNIPNSALTSSTISGVALGGTLNALTIGTGLSGASYTGAAGVTIAIDNTVATTSTAQVITNKTIAAGSNTISGLTNANLSGTAGITNANLANSTVTIGTTQLALGASSTTLAGLTQVDIGNLRVTGNTISSTNTNGNIILAPNGTGTVDFNAARLTSVATPTTSTDAANKSYVDSVATGLTVKSAVVAATTAALSATYANGTAGVGATLTASSPVTLPTIDGYTASIGDRILVKNQASSIQNGIYAVTSVGSPWVLTRTTDYDNSPVGEATAGTFLFVEAGTTQASTGWVESALGTGVGLSLVFGTDAVTFTQFSGAGSYLAGNGLTLTGNTFAATGTNGITVGTSIQLASTVAGAGLNYAAGVLSVGGTAGRITVAGTTVDIAATYVGQTSITTVGTVAVGTWTATTIAAQYGGTGVTSYAAYDLLYGTVSGPLGKLAMGTAGQILQVNTTSNALVYGDIDGGTY
jgi:hypothetical protein